MQAVRIQTLLKTAPVGTEAAVQGWVRTRRDSKGGFSFLEVNDGSCLKNLQVVVKNDIENYEAEILKLQTGACVTIRGNIVESPAKGQAVEMHATKVLVHGWADQSYPLQKKNHSFDYLRTIAHLRPRTN